MKPTFYLLILTLFGQQSFAQLTVRNDSYIFGNDVVIYVEDDINLKEANTNLYLRNEAQIIQGAGNTGNSGLGRLSVYQEGTVNNYAYNYWSSPVGNVTTNTVGNSPFIPNQNIFDVVDLTTSNLAGYSTSGYNGTSSPLNIESYWLWKYNPGAAYSDWDFVGQSGTVDAGYGFSMKGTIGSSAASGQLYDFRGKPNEGEINTAVVLGQETLIGNPYPSALDARAFIHDPNNVPLLDSGTLYFWEQDQTINSHILEAYRGGYGSFTITASGTVGSYVPPTFNAYNSDGTLNTTGTSSTSGKQVRRYIPIGQGFMVKGATTGSLLTSDSHRVFYRESGTNSEFYRTSVQNQTNHDDQVYEIQYDNNGLQILPSDYKRFRLNIDFNNLYTRQLLHNFHETATPNFDYGLESKVFSALNTDANWIQNEEAYNTKADNFEVELTIPIGLKLDNQQLIRFRIFDIQNFESSQPIFLHDKVQNLYVNLKMQDFEVNLPQGNYNERFEIVFQEAQTLSNQTFDEASFVILQENNLNQLIIKNPNAIALKSVKLFDITGKQIFNKSDIETKTRVTFSTKNLSDGVYVTKIETKDGSTISKKVIISNK